MDPFSLLKAGGGIIGGIAGAINKQGEMKRQEEEYNRKAYGVFQNAQDMNRLLNPEATRRAAEAELSTAQGAAVDNALNMAAGQTANSGDGAIGGQSGLVGSSAAIAASTPYAQQSAALHGQKLQAEQQQIGQEESLGNSIANLTSHVSYLNKQTSNPLKSILEGAVAGVTGGGAISNILEPELTKEAIQTTDRAQPQVNTGGPTSGAPLTGVTPQPLQAPMAQPQGMPGPAPVQTPGGLPIKARKLTPMDFFNQGEYNGFFNVLGKMM